VAGSLEVLRPKLIRSHVVGLSQVAEIFSKSRRNFLRRQGICMSACARVSKIFTRPRSRIEYNLD
jgi:hypothetical protein